MAYVFWGGYIGNTRESNVGRPRIFNSFTTNPSLVKSSCSVKASINRTGLSASTVSSRLPNVICNLFCGYSKSMYQKCEATWEFSQTHGYIHPVNMNRKAGEYFHGLPLAVLVADFHENPKKFKHSFV